MDVGMGGGGEEAGDATVTTSMNNTLARRRRTSSRWLTLCRCVWRCRRCCRRGVAVAALLRPLRSDAASWPATMHLAGLAVTAVEQRRCWGDGASGRAIARIGTIVRVGTARCRVESWRRKSVTEEFGRFSTRERSSGGMRTAAQAASDGEEHDLAHRLRGPWSDILFTVGLSTMLFTIPSDDYWPFGNQEVNGRRDSLRIYYIRNSR